MPNDIIVVAWTGPALTPSTACMPFAEAASPGTEPVGEMPRGLRCPDGEEIHDQASCEPQCLSESR